MKILHISDLHFGMHHTHIADCFLTDVSALKPDLVIISGDLTQRATHAQYQMFLSFAEKLPGKLCIVPGNHDVPLHQPIERLFFPFKRYNQYIAPLFPQACIHKNVRILGVNSVNPLRVKNGRLSTTTLEMIQNHFAEPFAGVNILFFHHNFDYREGLHKPLENYQAFLPILKDSAVDIVCTGHAHYAHVGTIEKNQQQKATLIHAGSLLCKRTQDGLNSYYLIEIENKNYSVEWRVFDQDRFVTRPSS